MDGRLMGGKKILFPLKSGCTEKKVIGSGEGIKKFGAGRNYRHLKWL